MKKEKRKEKEKRKKKKEKRKKKKEKKRKRKKKTRKEKKKKKRKKKKKSSFSGAAWWSWTRQTGRGRRGERADILGKRRRAQAGCERPFLSRRPIAAPASRGTSAGKRNPPGGPPVCGRRTLPRRRCNPPSSARSQEGRFSDKAAGLSTQRVSFHPPWGQLGLGRPS